MRIVDYKNPLYKSDIQNTNIHDLEEKLFIYI